jgi:hypothetical protein
VRTRRRTCAATYAGLQLVQQLGGGELVQARSLCGAPAVDSIKLRQICGVFRSLIAHCPASGLWPERFKQAVLTSPVSFVPMPSMVTAGVRPGDASGRDTAKAGCRRDMAGSRLKLCWMSS